MVRCGACKTTNTLGSGIKPLGYRQEKTVLDAFQGKSSAWLYALSVLCNITKPGHRSETSHAHGVTEKLNVTS